MAKLKLDPFICIALVYLGCSVAISFAAPDLRGIVPDYIQLDASRFDGARHSNPFISYMPSYHLLMGALFIPVVICNYILLSSRFDQVAVTRSAWDYLKLSASAFTFVAAMAFVVYSSFDPGESISTRSRLIFSVVYGSRLGLSIFMFIVYWIAAVMAALGLIFFYLSRRS